MNKKISIIGVNGKMGRWFADYFHKIGFEVVGFDVENEIIENRYYNINLDSYEGEEIEIRFHDGYSDYDDEIKEINKSKRFSIIAISLSILLMLLLQ